MEMNILCTVLARGGSKGLKNKNTKLLYGKPLIHYTLEQAQKSGVFTHVAVNSDSDSILETASKLQGIETVKRPIELANDTISKRPAIRQTVTEMENKYSLKYDVVIDLDCTSPLRDVQDIHNALNKFMADDNDNLITAMPSRRSPYFNMVKLDEKGRVKIVIETETPITCRQDAPACFDMNASIYIWKRDILFNTESNYLDKTGLYVMPEERSIDIDCQLDFDFVEFMIGKKNAEG
jgi:CMP-N,N'-diacetyllegionaminic acid synthase